MDETTTTGQDEDRLEKVPAEAMTDDELRLEISRQRRLLGVLHAPGLIAEAAERIAACARERERRGGPFRCPACDSTDIGAGPLSAHQCGRCGAWFGTLDEGGYGQICRGGWSADSGFENARYVDFTVGGEDGKTRRVHGWVNVFDGKWVQVG